MIKALELSEEGEFRVNKVFMIASCLEEEQGLEWGRSEYDNMGVNWQEVLPEGCIGYYVGAFADAYITLVLTDKEFIVGEGACMRPYTEYYRGEEEQEAISTWIKECHIVYFM